MAMAYSESREHIVMLPFMAQGHIIPFLALAKQLHQRTGYTITIANTPLNIRHLRTSLSNDSNICLAELTFCSSDHGLPPNGENTEFLTHYEMGIFIHATTSLKDPFHQLIKDITIKDGKPPLCIISDVFFGWAVDVAKTFKIPNFSFTTGGAYGTAAYLSVWLNLPHRKSDSDNFTVPGFPERCLFHISHLHRFIRAADGTDNWSKYFQTQLSVSLSSSGWLCNTVEEIEPLGLKILKNFVKQPVWCVGPLLPLEVIRKLSSASSGSSISAPRVGKQPGISPARCIDWLNMHTLNSVLYISFGSQNTINLSQMMELAKGLEESGKPFIWSIRPPLGYDTKGEFKAEWLPEGFEERIAEKKHGLLVHKWAPQLEILSHKSTGAFLSHCGWNSVLESLSFGVPVIGWPLAAEQGYNSKMLVEEMGVSVELTRGVDNAIDGKEVKRLIEMVMDDKGKGGEMRKKAAEIGELVRNAVRDQEGEIGSSVRAIDDFVMTAIAKRNQMCPGSSW